MTRQKKELLRKIDTIDDFITVDTQLAYGCVPPGAYDGLYKEKDALYEELARLMHYGSAMEMFNDERGTTAFEISPSDI